jgi:hypothetical protein
VIVNDLNIGRFHVAVRPGEADAPLAIDANAVLAGATSPEYFQAIASQLPKGLKVWCGPQDKKAAMCLPGKSGECWNASTVGEMLGALVRVLWCHRAFPYNYMLCA